jgi:hypothetical protein
MDEFSMFIRNPNSRLREVKQFLATHNIATLDEMTKKQAIAFIKEIRPTCASGHLLNKTGEGDMSCPVAGDWNVEHFFFP